MLPDQVTQLLTAFVDGELSQRERKAVTRLLQRSSEAREVLRQLQENAHRVHTLPRRKLEPSLVEDVLQSIASQPALPRPPRAPRRLWKPYAAASLAASLLVAAIGALTWQAMSTPERPVKDDAQIAVKQNPTPAPEKKNEPTPPTPPVKKPMNPMLAQITEDSFRGFAAPVPEPRPFAASFSELRKEGVMTGQLARQKSIGGEVLCYVW